jgi:hypothetical protein
VRTPLQLDGHTPTKTTTNNYVCEQGFKEVHLTQIWETMAFHNFTGTALIYQNYICVEQPT